MKKIILILISLIFMVGCVDLFGPEENEITPEKKIFSIRIETSQYCKNILYSSTLIENIKVTQNFIIYNEINITYQPYFLTNYINNKSNEIKFLQSEKAHNFIYTNNNLTYKVKFLNLIL
jgi:uncharacterized protein YcfL